MRPFGGTNDVRIGWILAIVLAVGGYAGIVAPAQRGVRAITVRARDLYELADHNERLLTNAAGLSAARRRVARDVAELSLESTSVTTAIATVRLLRSEERREGIVVSALSPNERTDTATPETGEDGSEDVTIAMRGPYRNVLGAIADLSKNAVLLEVRDAALVQAANDATARDVDATVRATLYHRIAAIMKEKHRVQRDDR